jgi:hypothetical protein
MIANMFLFERHLYVRYCPDIWYNMKIYEGRKYMNSSYNMGNIAAYIFCVMFALTILQIC